MAVVHALYFTHPACAWSWGLEPALRRLQVEFGAAVDVTYVMAPPGPQFAPAQAQVAEWLDAAGRTRMPIDPRIWLHDAPRSPHPACLAVKAAASQGRDGALLRRLREGLLTARRRLDSLDLLLAQARGVGGLDIERLRLDLLSDATVEGLGADLERAREAQARSPALHLRGPRGQRRVEGWVEPTTVREAALSVGAVPARERLPSTLEALRHWAPLAEPEVAAICGLPGPRAAAELWQAAVEWQARAERRLTGELWYPA